MHTDYRQYILSDEDIHLQFTVISKVVLSLPAVLLPNMV